MYDFAGLPRGGLGASRPRNPSRKFRSVTTVTAAAGDERYRSREFRGRYRAPDANENRRDRHMIKNTLAAALAAAFIASGAAVASAAPLNAAETALPTAQDQLSAFDKVMRPGDPVSRCTGNRCR